MKLAECRLVASVIDIGIQTLAVGGREVVCVDQMYRVKAKLEKKATAR